MERFDFSSGHIFMDYGVVGTDRTAWTLQINGSGCCGFGASRDAAIKNLLSHYKLSGKLKSEVTELLVNKNPEPDWSTGEQLELF